MQASLVFCLVEDLGVLATDIQIYILESDTLSQITQLFTLLFVIFPKSWQTQGICQEIMLKSAGRYHGGAALIYDGSNHTMELALPSASLVLISQTGKCSLIRGCFFCECQNKTFAFQRDTDYLLAIISLENPLFQEIVFSLFTSESLHTAFQDVTKVRANYLHSCHMSIDTLQLSI